MENAQQRGDRIGLAFRKERDAPSALISRLEQARGDMVGTIDELSGRLRTAGPVRGCLVGMVCRSPPDLRHHAGELRPREWLPS